MNLYKLKNRSLGSKPNKKKLQLYTYTANIK